MSIEISASSLWSAGASLLYVSGAVNVGRCVAAGKPAQQQARRRQLDEGLARLDLTLIVLGQTPVANQPGEAAFDGLITNDKCCFVRCLVLPLSWWRRPLHLRTLSLQSRGVVHAGGTDETCLEHPSPLRGKAQQPDALGSSVSAPPALDDQRSGRAPFPRSLKGGV
jgi:hypothetical protein